MRAVGLAALLALVAAACGSGDDGAGEGAGGRPASQGSDGLAEAGGDLPGDEFDMADGITVTFADLLDGRPLVMNYFASWCAPCRAEMPDFAAVHTTAGDRVRFVGVALQDTPDDAAEIVEASAVGVMHTDEFVDRWLVCHSPILTRRGAERRAAGCTRLVTAGGL